MAALTYLTSARRIVVKVGSALLVNTDGTLRAAWLDGLAHDLAGLKRRGYDIVVVSSGAIAFGRNMIVGAGEQRNNARLNLAEKQAAAAIGQIRLSTEWQQAMAKHNMTTAQILLSPDDTETRRKHLNARATLITLLEHQIVPVVNENDTVATAEIRYGDNDRLAARVAQMISADALILLSDVDGLYSSDPNNDSTAKHIPEVSDMTADIMAMAGPARHAFSSGGMITKLEAARIATSAGCHMAICHGGDDHPIRQLYDGGTATWFRANSQPLQARKTWIDGGLTPKGAIMIDDGASQALSRGKSLLAAGITAVTGNFDKGDLVAITDPANATIARGLTRYSASDIHLIKGHNSGEIETILGYRDHDEVIHTDDLVVDAVARQSQKKDM
ncbi:MAG: glutamate 5-kinase [Alphaproteobacteria bacterium]|jgi:glutamate 5-kinase|nr:glutamate 5-kinase [Alphaproteobacteria bacterium]MDG2467208.1 glutamate 5-kinase [Alphaproteobacteria bacterium]